MKEPYIIKIAMVGPTRVGKSSIIASMYKTLDADLASKGITFRATGQSSDIMDEKKADLQDLAEEDEPSVDSIFAITGDNTRSEYSFLVDLDPVKSDGDDIRIVFIDMPGRLYHNGNSDYDEPAKDIYDSDMSIVAIHTPALMKGSRHQREINKSDKIYNAFKKASPKEGSIIMMCPVRSEKWVNSGTMHSVYEKLRSEYAELLNWAKGRKIRVVACCILTLGHLEFSEFLTQTNEDQFPERYKRKRPEFAPKYCDIPLRVALCEGCFRGSSKIQMEKHIGDVIWDWLKLPSEKNAKIETLQKFGRYLNETHLKDILVDLT